VKVHSDPILTIKKAWLADADRVIRGRLPGAFKKLRNLTSALSDGIGRVRTGFQAYTTANGGFDVPTGTDILKCVPIQSPASVDMHIYFRTDSGQKITAYPHFYGATQVNSAIDLNQSKTITATWTNPAANQMRWTGADALTFSALDDYYNGWIVKNTTLTEYAIIKDYEYDTASSGTATFTLVESVDAGNMNWAVTDDIIIYRSFHDDLTFSPAYNNDLANPVCVNSENSVIRISGGQSSTAGNKGIILFPRLTRAFLPSHADTLSFDAMYASERRCKPFAKSILYGSIVAPGTGGSSTTLPTGYTYWFGIAPVYDGFQIGELCKFESSAADYTPSGGTWADNYIASTATSHTITVNVNFALSTLNKRITGIALYLAQDVGDTSSTGRVNPYYFLKHTSLVSTDPYGNGWVHVNGVFTQGFQITGDWWNAKGGTYTDDCGYLPSTTETMYSYSTEEIVSGRRLIANAYVSGESQTDRQRVFTNPTGGNIVINNGVVQPDIFPNEEGVYRVRVNPTVGTKINAIVPSGPDEFVILKNRGIINCRMVIVNNRPELIQMVESKDVGCTTPNAYAKDDSGAVFFPSYDDVYSYRNGILTALIERPDKNDWLSTYRAISPTNKEGASVVYLPELKSVLFLFGNQLNPATPNYYNDLQFLLDKDGWKSVYFGQSSGNVLRSFKYWTSLSNGHVIGTDTYQGNNASTFRMTWKYSGGSYIFGYLDDASAIIPYFDTGDFFFEQDKEYAMSEIVVNRSLTDSTVTGDLDIDVKADGTQMGFSAVSGTNRIRMKPTLAAPRRANKWQIIYNTDSTPNQLNSGNVYQVDSIEFHGNIVSRRRAISE